MKDVRGIDRVQKLTWNNIELEFMPGTRLPVLGNGLHGVVGRLDMTEGTRYAFTVNLMVRGMEQIEFMPVGRQTQISIRSPWPHPSFIGLPTSRVVTDKGFSPEWRTSFFATNIEQIFQRHTSASQPSTELLNNNMGAALIEPVNIYLKSERAIKYALLFVALTFAALFMTEIFKRRAVHPRTVHTHWVRLGYLFPVAAFTGRTHRVRASLSDRKRGVRRTLLVLPHLCPQEQGTRRDVRSDAQQFVWRPVRAARRRRLCLADGLVTAARHPGGGHGRYQKDRLVRFRVQNSSPSKLKTSHRKLVHICPHSPRAAWLALSRRGRDGVRGQKTAPSELYTPTR